MIRTLAQTAMNRLQARPSTAAGLCAFGVAFALVAGNALYSQPGSHPVPIWATRDATTTRSVAERAPAADLPSQIATTALTLENVPVPLSRPERTSRSVPALSLVQEAQLALHKTGYYQGEIDGLYGPMTRRAVMEFQAENALEENGQISKVLLDRMHNAPPKRKTVIANEKQAPAKRRDGVAALLQAAASSEEEASIRPTRITANEARTADLFQEDIHEIRDSALTARVQIGLINFGETEIAVDGVLGSKTSSAIRAFQERYGLAVTGAPDLAVIRKMEQIGALSQS